MTAVAVRPKAPAARDAGARRAGIGTHAQRLLAGASFLTERLASEWVAPAATVTEAGRLRLRRWRERLGGDDALAARLAALGTDERTALRALSGARLLSVPDDSWARLLVAHDGAAPPERCPQWPDVPYAALLGPIAARAWALLGETYSGDDFLAPEVVPATLAEQVRRASWWLGPALHRSFAEFRGRHLSRLDVALLGLSPAPDDTFARRFADDGRTLWRRRPILARLAAQLAADQAAFVARVLRHLRSDTDRLAPLLGGQSPGRLVRLETGLGDRHEGGRSVCRLTFDGGVRLIYRPRRHDGLDLLRRVLEQVDAPPLPEQLAVADHAWVSHVDSRSDVDDLAAYHRAAGGLIAALHALRSTDVHRDNIVVTPHGPVVVDAETVAHPVTAFETVLADELRDRPFPAPDVARSVLRTGLLPAWDFTADGKVLDGAHLLPALPSATRITVPMLDAAGTDGEELVLRPASPGPRTDLPAPGYAPAQWAETVAGSFARAGERIREPGPLDGVRLRLLHRYTRRYVDLLLHALRSPGLDHGVDLDVELDALRAGTPGRAGQAGLAGIVDAELADLRRLDVPYFEHEPHTGRVLHRGREVGRLERTAETVAGVSTVLARDGQQALIRSALRAHDCRPELTGGSAADLAGALLHDLTGRAIPLSGNGHTWLGFEYRRERFIRLPVGWSLYDGQAGIALALAAGAAALRDDALADAALRALRPVSRRVLADPASLCRDLGPGYLHGAAGVVWGLRHSAALLDDPEVAAAARTLERTLAVGLVHRADPAEPDLASGLAGALAVLADPAEGPVRAPAALRLGALRRAATTVLSTTDLPTTDLPGGGADLPAGVAHGHAGIALGLLRAAAALAPADPALSSAATDRAGAALARALGAGPTGNDWCAGRTGIDAVARVRRDGGPVVDRVAAGAPHHLCCGLVGSAVTAVAGAATRDRRRVLGEVLARLADERTPRYLAPLPVGLHQPGLLQGAAGLALGLLLLDGAVLPDPLAVSPL